MERFCVEIAIRFLPQWLQNNWYGIVYYAWAIFLYVNDQHIHELQACDIRGMRVSRFRW